MALLSTLRMALRPRLLEPVQMLRLAGTPMATTAQESANKQMKEYWEKNQRLKRPNSPWIIYEWHFPMMTSLTHRFTGCVMTAGLYAGAIAILCIPMDVTAMVAAAKAWNLGPAFWFPMKAAMAFPLNYHYLNGMRHLYWDYKGGYELDTQYKTGTACFVLATALSFLFAGYAYM